MTYGVILTGYGMREYIGDCLMGWADARKSYLRGHGLLICAVSVPFAGFPETADDGTLSELARWKEDGWIDHIIDGPKHIPETTARGMALQWLKDAGADIVWQVDMDELYEFHDIARIVEFVDANPFAQWYRVSLKNLVFTPDQYLAEPFTPPRIHRIRADGYRAHSFSGDNDIQYGGTITRDILHQSRFASMTIPPSVANPRHFTWLSDLRSKKKVAYQRLRWGHCSFKWDDVSGLSFDEDYFRQQGIMVPKVVYQTACHIKDSENSGTSIP